MTIRAGYRLRNLSSESELHRHFDPVLTGSHGPRHRERLCDFGERQASARNRDVSKPERRLRPIHTLVKTIHVLCNHHVETATDHERFLKGHKRSLFFASILACLTAVLWQPA